jgi:hypothetical protein
MIGWRPYLLTGLALVVLAVVVLDVVAADRPAPECATADGLRAAGFLARADRAYASILSSDAASGCAQEGRRTVTDAQCRRVRAIGAADAAEQRKQVLRLAAADPEPPTDSCVWAALAALPPATTSTSAK